MQDPTLLGISKTKVLVQLLSGSKKAQEVAAALNVQTSAVRKHLDDLERLGIVGQEFQRIGVGRPRKLYGLTEKGKELFPRRYDTVLDNVLAKLVQLQGRAYTESVLNAIAEDLAKTMNGETTAGKDKERVADGLNEFGFQANIKEDSHSFVVTSGNCPLLKTATQHSELVCRGLHETMLKQALGGRKVSRESWILAGDSYCKHVIPKRG